MLATMTTTIEQQLSDFKQERDAALLSLDEQKIRAFYMRWNPKSMTKAMLTDSDVFWAAVHKAITAHTGLPLDFRRKSKVYLDAKGLQSWDDGDL